MTTEIVEGGSAEHASGNNSSKAGTAFMQTGCPCGPLRFKSKDYRAEKAGSIDARGTRFVELCRE